MPDDDDDELPPLPSEAQSVRALEEMRAKHRVSPLGDFRHREGSPC
jgi:hypothetical protein